MEIMGNAMRMAGGLEMDMHTFLEHAGAVDLEHAGVFVVLFIELGHAGRQWLRGAAYKRNKKMKSWGRGGVSSCWLLLSVLNP